MVLGHKESDDTFIVTSESAAVTAVGANLQRDVVPGELIKLSKSGIETEKFSDDQSRAHCSFEFTYFAHPSSNMEGRNIYVSRKRIGYIERSCR